MKQPKVGPNKIPIEEWEKEVLQTKIKTYQEGINTASDVGSPMIK